MIYVIYYIYGVYIYIYTIYSYRHMYIYIFTIQNKSYVYHGMPYTPPLPPSLVSYLFLVFFWDEAFEQDKVEIKME